MATQRAFRLILFFISIIRFIGLASAQQPSSQPVPTPAARPAPAALPPVSFVVGSRRGHVTPTRTYGSHTGGGIIEVVQPAPDTLIITMSGAAVAFGAICDGFASQRFDLEQEFAIRFGNPAVKNAKLTMEGRVFGLLRSRCKNDTAGYNDACASVVADSISLLHLCVPPHSVGGGEHLSVNDHRGPFAAPIFPGNYCLRQTFVISASAHKCLVSKGTSAEFAPNALSPAWLDPKEPFRGAAKRDFGFQIVLQVAEDTDPPANAVKEVLPGTEQEK
jgi:hypothetical protein